MQEQNRADVGIWRLVGNVPQRYMPATLEYEKHLETWIEHDPTLVSPDLQLIGRQVRLDTGFLDILGIDNLERVMHSVPLRLTLTLNPSPSGRGTWKRTGFAPLRLEGKRSADEG
jgi:hypothetical protein